MVPKAATTASHGVKAAHAVLGIIVAGQRA
jgi:hypothetical protein